MAVIAKLQEGSSLHPFTPLEMWQLLDTSDVKTLLSIKLQPQWKKPNENQAKGQRTNQYEKSIHKSQCKIYRVDYTPK